MAARYRFDKDFDFKVRDKSSGSLVSTVAYRAGTEALIPDDHADAADAAGAGKRAGGATSGAATNVNQSASGAAPAQSPI